MEEAKFVQKRLWIKSYQKMNSWSSQVLEGIKECKCGINLFVQREQREEKWQKFWVCSSLVLLWRYSGVLSALF